MLCLVTCGPTYEPLDKVRRLTNFSTGKLGIGLANFLHDRGHEVTLLKGYYAVCQDRCAVPPIPFTTTEDLEERLLKLSHQGFHAVFHAAAVSDFKFGKVYERGADGALEEITAGKFRTRSGVTYKRLLAELVPTSKILARLRAYFLSSYIVGWKYEVDGDRETALISGRAQLAMNASHLCVVNGPAYGEGFGVVSHNSLEHCVTAEELYSALLRCAG